MDSSICFIKWELLLNWMTLTLRWSGVIVMDRIDGFVQLSSLSLWSFPKWVQDKKHQANKSTKRTDNQVRLKVKIKASLTLSHLRLRTRLLFWGRSRKSMRKSIRAWVSFDVNPWMRPKNVSVSLMVNSLYSARSCQVGKAQQQN